MLYEVITIISISPMIGSSSLLETGLFKVTFVVPSGAKNGGRALPNGFSRNNFV